MSSGPEDFANSNNWPYWEKEEVDWQKRANAAERDLTAAHEALRKIAEIKDKTTGGDWDEIEEARKIADAALGIPKGEKPTFNKGDRVRVNHPHYHGEGIVQYDSGYRPRVIAVLLENGNTWDYEVDTVTLLTPPAGDDKEK